MVVVDAAQLMEPVVNANAGAAAAKVSAVAVRVRTANLSENDIIDSFGKKGEEKASVFWGGELKCTA